MVPLAIVMAMVELLKEEGWQCSKEIELALEEPLTVLVYPLCK